MMTPKELAILAAKALDEKKGKEISAIEITDITTLADYFVIATGSSNTQINALYEQARKSKDGKPPKDADPMQLSRAGVAAALMSIPLRYMHTPGEIVSTDDLDRTVELLAHAIAAMKPGQRWIPF